MTLKAKEPPAAPDPVTAGGDLVPSTTGSLNLRPEVIDGFTSVREKHQALQALLHQMMRRVALPHAREIGEELIRLKGFYPKGKKGPMGHASRFYSDARALTGLSKPSVAGYIQLAEGWHRLIDYMSDLPEGATPITSLRGALDALREMNRPLRPASDAIDVEAQQVAGDALPGAGAGGSGHKRTNYAASTREKVLPALTTLRTTTVITERQREQLAKIEEMLSHLLTAIEQQEEQAAADAAAAEPPADQQVVEVPVAEPEPALQELVALTNTTPAPAPAPEAQWSEQEQQVEAEVEPNTSAPAAAARGTLGALYPATAEGLRELENAIAEAGGGAALARQLGIGGDHGRKRVSGHLAKLRAAVAIAGEV